MKKILILFFIFITQLNTHGKNNNNDLACYYLKNFNMTYEKLTETPLTWMNGNDSCVVGIIDSLMYYYLQEMNVQYLLVLDTISTYSDGYISESIQHDIGLIFEKKPVNLIRFVSFIEQEKNENKIKQFLIWYLIDRYGLDNQQERNRGIKKIKKKFQSIIKEHSLKKQEKKFIKKLKLEIIQTK